MTVSSYRYLPARFHVPFFAMALFWKVGCGTSDDGDVRDAGALRDGAGEDSAPNDAASAPCTATGGADYRLTFTATWSAATHPISFPPGPHFSGLIGASHKGETVLWQGGAVATAGIEQMAETGGKTVLRSEVQAEISSGGADQIIDGGGIGVSPGSVSVDFRAEPAFPFVSIVSMIAPSPDWFVGVHGLGLCNGNAWREVTVELAPYDAGTDSGTDYTSANADTEPPEAIHLITGAPLADGETVPPLGTFAFTFL